MEEKNNQFNSLYGKIPIPTASIAEAKNQLPVLVHSLEEYGMVNITRRGKIVAYLLSVDYYNKMFIEKRGFFSRLEDFRSNMKKKDYLEESEMEDIRLEMNERIVDIL